MIPKLASELNRLADEANEAIRAFEEEMVEVGAGVSVMTAPYGSHSVGFARIEGNWRVTVDGNIAANAERKLRIYAAQRLADLRGAVERALRKELDETKEGA